MVRLCLLARVVIQSALGYTRGSAASRAMGKAEINTRMRSVVAGMIGNFIEWYSFATLPSCFGEGVRGVLAL